MTAGRVTDQELAEPEAERQGIWEAMRDAGFPVAPHGEIAAEVAAGVHRLGLDRKPGRAQR